MFKFVDGEVKTNLELRCYGLDELDRYGTWVKVHGDTKFGLS